MIGEPGLDEGGLTETGLNDAEPLQGARVPLKRDLNLDSTVSATILEQGTRRVTVRANDSRVIQHLTQRRWARNSGRRTLAPNSPISYGLNEGNSNIKNHE